jgi:hypothetical protein
MNGLGHLARRFFQGLVARPLPPTGQAEVAACLSRDEAQLFWRQSPLDQRHALAGARAVQAMAPGRADLARAALLHDVGKACARLGVPGRVVATTLSLLHLPAPGRLGAYLAHGPRGAELLRARGADPLAVDYACHHHGARPAAIAPRDWEVLARADRV